MTEVQVIENLCNAILKKHRFDYKNEGIYKYNDSYLLSLVDMVLCAVNQAPNNVRLVEQLSKVRLSMLKTIDAEGYQYLDAQRYVWSKSLVDAYNYIWDVCMTTRSATRGIYNIMQFLYITYTPNGRETTYEKPRFKGTLEEMRIYMK